MVPKDTPRVIHAKAPLDDPMLLLRTPAPCRDERDEIDERREGCRGEDGREILNLILVQKNGAAQYAETNQGLTLQVA